MADRTEEEDNEPKEITGGELLVAVCGGLAVVAAVVALVLGHEVIAAILGLAGVGMIIAGGPSGSVAWGRGGRRWSMADSDFEDLVNQVEQRPPEPLPARRDPHDRDDFEALIAEALDELPGFMQAELERNVAVVISEEGAERGAYGLYFGDTVARDDVSDRILIYRDTLLRDFGDDPAELRRQVTITVRHELAHHLGAGEDEVRDLGL